MKSMELKKCLKYSLELFSWLSFIALSIGLIYFVKEVWNDYISKKTNDRVYSMKKTEFEHPTVTICFEPQINATALQKYNLSLDHILSRYRDTDLAIPSPFINFVNEIGFRIGHNVELNLKLANRNGEIIKINFSEGNTHSFSKHVQLQEIIGIYHGI